MADENPQAPRPPIENQAPSYTAERTFFGVLVNVHVLPTGTRVFDGNDVFAILRGLNVGVENPEQAAELEQMWRWFEQLPGPVQD